MALPCESASGRCFLQLYIESILALQVQIVRCHAAGYMYIHWPYHGVAHTFFCT